MSQFIGSMPAERGAATGDLETYTHQLTDAFFRELDERGVDPFRPMAWAEPHIRIALANLIVEVIRDQEQIAEIRDPH